MSKTITTICICGAGTMGSGITLSAALNGYTCIQYDVAEPMLHHSKAAIESNLAYLVKKEKIQAADAIEVLNRISFTSNLQACVADVIIEAIIENLSIKTQLFNSLATINATTTIFASNTSSLSIAHLQAKISNPERVAGFHFFNPAHIMKLVEVVQGPTTATWVVEALTTLAINMKKQPVRCEDSPGFIVNHVARPYYLAGLNMVEQGLCAPETVDAALEAAGFKMGPFKLMDLIGMDINYHVSQIVWNALGQPARLTPSALQKSKVDKGELGRKTSLGFYKY